MDIFLLVGAAVVGAVICYLALRNNPKVKAKVDVLADEAESKLKKK